ncbi:DUF3850 domain-containing protein [Escherichia coli]|uniref:DUF3850 domain-containing protein n=1 Tax=Escherichia coli TaxID=562 RepID=UPI0024E01609|nr:DUF3850 domain-containing protein [Escherichia coli]WIC11198.1 DUF3850 domain-containing protein [Escherichia coli]
MTFTKEQTGRTHKLKIWSEYFGAVRDSLKRAELRWNDREYQAGDILDLCEWDPNEEAFTGDHVSVTVTHVAELGQWMPGYVLLSIELEAQKVEPVGYIDADYAELLGAGHIESCSVYAESGEGCVPLYTAPPAPVVPEEMPKPDTSKMFVADAVAAISRAEGWNACRAAMLQGDKS